jgi:eukaryotic-like serine/threonine-protein kinase
LFRAAPHFVTEKRRLIRQLDLNNYLLGDVLGVGTVGTIYAAVDAKTKAAVAVKRLHPGVSRDPLIRARFEREMIILERLQHPNIIRYFGGGEQNGQLFYVMELVDGGTVKDLLESQGRFPWPVVVELARQICSALQCAHNHGVIHRDLKPGNLFLNRDGELKLGDFGIARDLTHSDLTDTGMTVGTHAYMAPEQITGDSRISGQVDLYALGCCLFEMLVGRKVYQGENFAQLFEQHLRGKPDRVSQYVPECPTELDEIVNQLLSKNPLDRPFNARAVQGVMLKLQSKDGESPTGLAKEPVSGVRDVAADKASMDGRSMLRDQISQRFESPSRNIAMGRALAIVIVLIVVVGLASWLSR